MWPLSTRWRPGALHSKLQTILGISSWGAITRYFGGIKLGTGGLVRAYSNSVQMALQKLPLAEFVTSTTAQITLPFPFENRIRRLLEKMKVTITDVKYKDQVVLFVEFPENMGMKLEQQIRNQTQGQAQFNGLTDRESVKELYRTRMADRI